MHVGALSNYIREIRMKLYIGFVFLLLCDITLGYSVFKPSVNDINVSMQS